MPNQLEITYFCPKGASWITMLENAYTGITDEE